MTHDKEALIALRERVREAEGADREIDWSLYQAFTKDNQAVRNARHLHDGYPLYTASIDAALALVEMVFPEWQHVTWGGVFPYGGMAELRSGAPECLVFSGKAETLPLAILDAFLTAMIERETAT